MLDDGVKLSPLTTQWRHLRVNLTSEKGEKYSCVRHAMSNSSMPLQTALWSQAPATVPLPPRAMHTRPTAAVLVRAGMRDPSYYINLGIHMYS